MLKQYSYGRGGRYLPMIEETYFSIIIPVYKVEAYLEECVQSILNQTFNDYEIILIDDGSPDSCPAICDKLSEEDSRIHVVHQKNGGLANARNTGMNMSNGKYIIFLDSDDYYSRNDSLEMMYKELESNSTDILILKTQKLNSNTNELFDCNNDSSTKDIADYPYAKQLEYCVVRQLYDSCAWNKVFKRSLFLRNDLNFTEGIIAEDIDWAARLCLVAKSIAILKYPVHVYRINRKGSITSSLNMKNIIDTKNSIERCINYVKDLKMDYIKINAYFSYVSYRYIVWMAEAWLVNNKSILIEEMRKYDWILKYDLNKKVRLVNKLYRITGYRVTSIVLSRYLKFNEK